MHSGVKEFPDPTGICWRRAEPSGGDSEWWQIQLPQRRLASTSHHYRCEVTGIPKQECRVLSKANTLHKYLATTWPLLGLLVTVSLHGLIPIPRNKNVPIQSFITQLSPLLQMYNISQHFKFNKGKFNRSISEWYAKISSVMFI